MWETLEDRLQTAECKILDLTPGYKPMRDWNEWIRRNPVLEWVWNTENINPKYMKKWVSVTTISPNICTCWCPTGWRQIRERAWAELFWSGLDFDHNGSWRYQMEYEPDLPSRDDSLEQYRILLSSIPVEVFKWTNAEWREKSQAGYKWNIWINFRFQIKYSCISLPFKLVEARARYWRKKIGAKSCEEIELLPWATDADLARISPSLYREMMMDKERPESPDFEPSEVVDIDLPTKASMIEELDQVIEQAEKDMAKSEKRSPTSSDEQVETTDHAQEEQRVELENTSPNKDLDQSFPNANKAGGEEASEHPSASSEEISKTDCDLASELEEPKRYDEIIPYLIAKKARGGYKKPNE